MASGGWILILTGLGVIAGLASLWRASEARAVGLVAANEKVSAEREELAARLAREAQGRKKQAEELATLRKRADKARKRETKGAPNQPLGTASRIADLEAELARTLRERNQGQIEREELAKQVAQLQARLEVSTRAAETARFAPPPASAAPSPGAAAPGIAPGIAPGPVVPGLEEIQMQLAERTERLAKLENELGQAKQAEARARKRMSNQEQLYASVRAELEVKKDRLRTQEEQIQRMQALNAAVGE